MVSYGNNILHVCCNLWSGICKGEHFQTRKLYDCKRNVIYFNLKVSKFV